MTQKQIVGSVIGVVALVVAYVLVYRQMSGQNQAQTTAEQAAGIVEQKNLAPAAPGNMAAGEIPQPVPSSIDGVTQNIESGANTDATAMQNEADSANAQVESDKTSVNDLGQSYDENNL